MNPKLYIVPHIYKTAGQTLHQNFKLNFVGDTLLPMYTGPIGLDKSVQGANPGWDLERINDYVARRAGSHTRCIFGHMAYFGVHNFVKADVEPCYIAFFREPVERCVSLYYFLKAKSVNTWHDEIVRENWSLEEWFEKTEALWKYNGQLRQLLLNDHPEVLTEAELTREHLEEGKRRLQQFWYVGLSKAFDDDSQYLYGKLGFRKFWEQERVNVTPVRKEVTPQVKQVIAQHNALDQELFEFAGKLRAEFIENNALDFHLHKNKAKMMKATYLKYRAIRPDRNRVKSSGARAV